MILPVQTYLSCAGCSRKIKLRMWVYSCPFSRGRGRIKFSNKSCAAGLLASGTNVIEIGIEDGKTYPNLMRFPRPRIDLLMADLITEHQSINSIDTKKMKDGVDNEKEGCSYILCAYCASLRLPRARQSPLYPSSLLLRSKYGVATSTMGQVKLRGHKVNI
ncbi:hypothetical protein POM88_050564 [Heracleum sosnowskyi]|uniref:Uncharacterized protein n=1 Tax=Heracleum sosnowskyi TaxID=360622 RepID=A0AAD8GZ42_9APIA|nr:hypothetical protein POM88_050564 [Heracleum sosnowskyi]